MPLDQDPKGVLAGRVAVGLEMIQELAIGHGSECPRRPTAYPTAPAGIAPPNVPSTPAPLGSL